jgi:hydrophobe/amphiphile efflux-1 (HAE1) family protein
MRNISSWAIKNPVFPIVLFIFLMMLGILAFIRLPINNNPDISFPFISVNVSQPGASPVEVETQITQKIEASLSSIPGVKNMQSRAGEGYSWTGIEFEIGTPVDRAVSDVRDAISKVRGELPEGIFEPTVERQDTDGGAIAYFSVGTKNMTPEQLSWFVDDNVSKRLRTISGVANVQRFGGVNREIRIDLDPQRMQAFGITAAEVNGQLRQLNLDASGGVSEIGGAKQAIRILGQAKTAESLGAARINSRNGISFRLSDIAKVSDGIGERTNISRLNGVEVTQFGVFKAKGYSEVTVADKVDAELAKIQKENPQISVSKNYTNVTYTKEQYKSALEAMIEGAILAVIVVWFFLRDWRATLISALAIPLSAIPAFWFMSLLGFTLNGMSLLALSLVAGILVDDAIVEIENIVRHMRMGKTAYQASLDAADEIGLAVVATTGAIVAVFLPVGLMGGIAGQYFKQFGLTIVAAVIMSLAVARLITPLIAAYFLRSHGVKSHGEGPTMERYLGTLQWTLRNRWKTLGIALLFFLGSGFVVTTLKSEFFPPFDDGTAQLSITMPPGSRLEDTAAVSAKARDILLKQQGIVSVVEDINVGDANHYVTVVPKKERSISLQEWRDRATKELSRIPDARINFQSQNGGFGRDWSLVIAGADSEVLERTAHNIIDAMRKMKEFRDPRINGDLQRPEILIKPRLDLASELGVSVAELSQTVRIATQGDIPQNLAKMSVNGRQINIRVSLPESARTSLATIENLPVPTVNGGSVPLKAVADIRFGQGPTTVRRYNQQRRIVLEADFPKGVASSDANAALNKLDVRKNLPNDIAEVKAGQSEAEEELLVNFLIAIVTGTLLVIGTIILLYKHVFQPFTNLGSLLLAPGGAFIALKIADMSISLPVYIGLLMLMGIVAKNSILLIDFAIEEMRLGKDRGVAILEAAHKRAQPILMTTIAMIAGMIPISLGLTGDASFRAPMAVAVMGGLVTSTILTLLIVPAAFTLMDDLETKVGRRFKRLLTTDEIVPTISGAKSPAAHQPAE